MPMPFRADDAKYCETVDKRRGVFWGNTSAIRQREEGPRMGGGWTDRRHLSSSFTTSIRFQHRLLRGRRRRFQVSL